MLFAIVAGLISNKNCLEIISFKIEHKFYYKTSLGLFFMVNQQKNKKKILK